MRRKIKIRRFGKGRKIIITTGIILLSAVVLIAGVFIYNCCINKSVVVTSYSVTSEKLPEEFDGYSIMVISDYHNAVFWKDISDKVNKHHPDMVLFTGDLTQLHRNYTDNLKKLIENINYSPKKYFISGNHESMSVNYNELMEKIEGFGLENIDDKDVKIYDKNKKSYIKLIGLKDPVVEDVVIRYNQDKIERMAELVDYKSEKDEFVITALHRANLFPYFTETNSSLILSGHLHGGIIRIPGLGGLISDEGLWPQYDAGKFVENGVTMIVSRGCDYNLDKMRFFNRPEILMVTLIKK